MEVNFLIGSYIALTIATSLVDRFSEIAITTRLGSRHGVHEI